MKSLLRLLNHRVYFSVAWSPTALTRAFAPRVGSLLVGFFLLALMPWMALLGRDAVVPAGALASEDSYIGRLKNRLASMESDESFRSDQLQQFAQELGTLQARLERFDIISERLFNTEEFSKHLEGVDALAPAVGDGPAVTFGQKVSPLDIEMGLGYLTLRTDAISRIMDRTQELLQQTVARSQRFTWPVVHQRAYISSGFGFRKDPFHGNRGYHAGIDIAAGWNAPIVAANDGVVTFVGYKSGYGLAVEMMHTGNITTRYAHLNKALAKVGQQANAGELIALMGSTGRSTGPHLHFEIAINGERVDPEPFVAPFRSRAIDLALGREAGL
jgi:murein DD-endopeptidase MepM/ murein hydrolase activator NlpD